MLILSFGVYPPKLADHFLSGKSDGLPQRGRRIAYSLQGYQCYDDR